MIMNRREGGGGWGGRQPVTEEWVLYYFYVIPRKTLVIKIYYLFSLCNRGKQTSVLKIKEKCK